MTVSTGQPSGWCYALRLVPEAYQLKTKMLSSILVFFFGDRRARALPKPAVPLRGGRNSWYSQDCRVTATVGELELENDQMF
jgi:hypothetical protein